MSVSRSRLRYSALGSLGIVVVIAFFALGLPTVDAALPAYRALDAGKRYAVGGGVSLVPPPGAVLDLTATRPGPDRGSALFLFGGVRYAVVVQPFSGTLDAAADRLATKITSKAGYRLDPDRHTVTVGDLPGITGDYAAGDRTGVYTVLLTDDRLVEITVAGPAAQMDSRHGEILHSMSTVTAGAAR